MSYILRLNVFFFQISDLHSVLRTSNPFEFTFLFDYVFFLLDYRLVLYFTLFSLLFCSLPFLSVTL